MLKPLAIRSELLRGQAFGGAHNDLIRRLTTTTTPNRAKFLMARWGGAKTGNRNELGANKEKTNCEEMRVLCGFQVAFLPPGERRQSEAHRGSWCSVSGRGRP
jgi:hypothetical protein